MKKNKLFFMGFVVWMMGVWSVAAYAGFVDNGNGTVTDSSTGLIWQQDMARDGGGNYDNMTWQEALAYCEALNLGGNTDWRLPTIKELGSLVDLSRYNPSINTTYFPHTMPSPYWSSTTHAYLMHLARNVGFYDGRGNSSLKSYYGGYVRAVRGGQSGSFDYVALSGNCNGKTPCYSTIQEAINAASTGAVILIARGTYAESNTLNQSKLLTLKGGWDSSFTSQAPNTTFIKAPKAPQGSLTLQMVTIRP